MFSNQVNLAQPVLKLHRITGNILPAHFNDHQSTHLSMCVRVCLCVSVHFHGQMSDLLDVFLRHNVFIQLHFIQPYSKSLQSRQQYSPVYFGPAFEMCIFPLYLSFQLSYNPDGTTVLCTELSEKVSDGV